MNVRALVLLLPLVLAACGSKEEMLAPSPLPDFRAEVTFDRLWSADSGVGRTSDGLALVPAVTGAAVYAADADGRLSAWARADGKRLWQQETGEPVSAGPVAGYDQVFVGTREGELIAYAAGTGERLWRVQLAGEVLAVPALDADAVVVKTTDGRLTLLDRLTGTLRWTHDSGATALSLRAASSPLLLADAVLVGTPAGILQALERSSGQLIWERRIAEPSGKSELDRLVDIAGDFVLQQDRLYVATYQGRMVAMDLRSGQFSWQQPLSTFQALAADADHAYAVDADSRVVALRATDGVVLWRLESLLGRSLTGGAILGDWLLVGDYQGWLHVIRRADGVLVGRRKIDGAGMAVTPVVDDGTVFALGNGGKLAVLQIRDRNQAAAATSPQAAP